ncbi:hypothetical protein [Corynebacterium diphtheriae]|uniref:hypothetical protein n=1 Tax=Corynebacterium diphtheriae TaxID=1717 RepID=UPI0018CADE05|nr:hypothetical protein [Corynebacterium diphtheriae]MBG9372509.1 hypothetical protein [Corynebacterium diphtheriae bv. mitis]
MFKRSLASVAAVAIASGAVVAPANAVAVRPHNNNKTCTLSFTAEEAKLIRLASSVTLSKEQATQIKSQYGEQQLPALEATIETYKKKLTESGLGEEEKEHLMSKLKESEKKHKVYKNFRDALNACIAGKYYNSDQLGDSKNPEGQVKPGGQDQSGGTDNPGGSKNPEVPGKPGDSNNPGPNNPGGPSNPGVTPAPPSNDGAGIGVIFAGAIAAILGILAAALPIIKPMLPPQLRALLP